MLKKEYGCSSSYLTTFYIKKSRQPRREVVYQRKYAKIIDKGPLITAENGNADEIRAMLELAHLKGWKRIGFDGDAQFKRDAMRAALLAGFEVVAKSPQDAAILQKVRHDLAPVNGSGPRFTAPAPGRFRL